jgi:4-hydroxy-tetrahydrodipicolinate reductase
MDKISVVVSGTGFMGREVLAAVSREDDLEPVGVVDKFANEGIVSLSTGAAIPLSSNPAELIERTKPRVIIDFTNAQWTPELAKAALDNGASMVIGTTGLSESFISEFAAGCKDKQLGAFIAPNFAIGAVVMIHLAKVASRFFDYAEITEMHQEKKLDAPSGTAMMAAREMAAGRGKPFEHTMPEKDTLAGARGSVYEGIAIHSQRMPGFVAHHEITFGGFGQSLRIRHDSNGRDSFIPGVLMATREVINRHELVVGLDKLIGL